MRIKQAITAAMAFVGMVLLSGCLKVEANLVLNSEALATGEYVISMNKETALLIGATDKETFKTAFLGTEGFDFPRDSIDVSDSGDSYVMTIKADDYALDDPDLNATVMNDGRIKLVFRQEGSETDSGGFAPELAVVMKFPGEIVEMSPEFTKVDSKTVSLKLSTDVVVPNAYVISESGESPSNSAPVDSANEVGASEETISAQSASGSKLPIGLGVLVIVLLLAVVVQKKRKSSSGIEE